MTRGMVGPTTVAARLARGMAGPMLARRATAAMRLPLSRLLSTRTESDAFGPIEVSTDVLWGAQTQRSLQNFPIGGSAARMPEPVIKAYGVLKKCATQYNMDAGLMDKKVGGAIVAAADEVFASARTRTGLVRAARARWQCGAVCSPPCALPCVPTTHRSSPARSRTTSRWWSSRRAVARSPT